MKLQFKFSEREVEEPKKWVSFYPKWSKQGFRFTFSPWWYFEPRPMIVTNISSLLFLISPLFLGWWFLLLMPTLFFSWGELFIRLPFNSFKDECEYPDYGLMFYSVDGEIPNHIWIRKRRSSKTINFPWAYKWWKREVLFKDGWRKEEKGNYFWDKEKWADQILIEKFPYNYKLKSGKIQERIATVYQEKCYWKNWFGLNVMMRHYLEIEFNNEVGEKSGSWKGGVLGCSFLINKGETSEQALRRMEKVRKF